MLKRTLALATLAILFMLSFMGQIALADMAPVQAFGVDTIAGFGTILRSSQTFPGQDVLFKVQKPDGSTIMIPAKTSSNGVAKTDLYDYHTRLAGQYFISARLLTDKQDNTASSFRVYPDKVSADNSNSTVDRTIAQVNGSDQTTVKVQLCDQYGNNMTGHQVSLISSRSHDTVTPIPATGITDVNGSVSFNVASNEKGVSTYTAMDTTSGTILAHRVSVAYMDAGSLLNDSGGDFQGLVDVARAASGTINHFSISGIPANVQQNQNVTFAITAQDDSNQTVQNYTGTVHFSAEGDNGSNVTFPEDYTFKAEDLGTHQFSLGLSFKTTGSYTIDVTDLSNTLIKGTQTVTVGLGGGSTQQAGGMKPTVDMPVSGTFSQKIQTISGKAPSGMNVQIYDNQQQIGSVQAASDGKYTFQTSPLNDGQHSVYVVTVDNSQTVQGTSNTVQFSIDTTPPSLDEITLTPDTGITPGMQITVKVLSEHNLSQAAVVFNGDIIQLNPSIEETGSYSGSIQSPSIPGVYPLDVLLVDQLNNEGSYKGKAQVTVSNEGGNVVTQEGTQQGTQEQSQEQTQEVVPPSNNPPSRVTNVISYASNKRITLVWDAATDNETFVKHYRVSFGTNSGNLDLYADTKDASTTWYIPNLENGNEYYFSVTAFDSEGLESASKSDIVSGIPFASEVITTLGQVSGALAGNLKPSALETTVPPTTPKSGPEIIWFLSGSGAVSYILQKLRQKIRK